MAVLREDQYLEDVFGIKASVEKEEWLDKMNTTSSWLYDPAQVRKRLFELAGVEVRHES